MLLSLPLQAAVTPASSHKWRKLWRKQCLQKKAKRNSGGVGSLWSSIHPRMSLLSCGRSSGRTSGYRNSSCSSRPCSSSSSTSTQDHLASGERRRWRPGTKQFHETLLRPLFPNGWAACDKMWPNKRRDSLTVEFISPSWYTSFLISLEVKILEFVRLSGNPRRVSANRKKRSLSLRSVRA